MANPVGRPSKYNDDLQAKADDYLYTWMETDALPSRVGLCCRLEISKTVSYDWEREHPRFLNTLRAVDTLQEYAAVNKGITGEFNPTIVKLVLANHGYSDKQDLTHSSPDGTMATKPTTINLVAGSPQEDDHSDD